MSLQEELKRLKEELSKEKKANKKLRKLNKLQESVIDSIQEVNAILADDERGKRLLWTTNFPHNLDAEVAQKIQDALKKRLPVGDGNFCWQEVWLALGKELRK